MHSRTNAARPGARLLFLAAGAAALALPAGAQGFKLAEGFDDLTQPGAGQQGPPQLVARGWTFRNQSEPLAGPSFQPGDSGGFPHDGAGFLGASSGAAGTFAAKLSSWAILPTVPGQAAADAVQLQVLGGGSPTVDTFLELRYSPTGGIGTGSGPFDVGDFTEVLFAAELPLTSQWVYTLVDATLPGAGRIALRFHAPVISSFPSPTVLYVDTLTVGGVQPPTCGLELPQAGETITWTAAGSPYVVCQTLAVPAGATLVLAAGSVVEFESSSELLVQGSLRAEGTAEAPVVLAGNHLGGLAAKGGSVLLEHANVGAAVRVHEGGSLEATASLFRPAAYVSTMGFPCFTRLSGCEMRSEVVNLAGTVLLEDVLAPDPTTFLGVGGVWNIRSLEAFAPIRFTANLQDRVIDHVTVTGAGAPALELHATAGAVDFLLGPDNVLEDNQYPVWIRFAGLAPESHLPLTGNVNDAILGFANLRADLRTRPSLPDLGLPYHFLERGTAAGDLRIAPGAVLRFGPDGGLTTTADRGSDPKLRGLPGAPIRFERLYPDQPWLSLASNFGLTLFEHLAVDGAGIGIVASEAELLLRDCTITRCALGARPASDGHIFGSGVRFLDNLVGLRNDTTNPAASIGSGIHFSSPERPNFFAGNHLAAENVPTPLGHHHEFPAEHCWWGDPTGPFDPLTHPSGQGDEVSWVDFQPFLASPPELDDQRPVVRLVTRLHPAVLPGEKIFIEWSAQDDGTIVEFDVQVLSDDLDAPYQTYVDLLSNLPGSARRCELVVPEVGLHPYERFPFRIVATDDAGNVGFEQFQLAIAHALPPGQVSFQTRPTGLRGGESLEVCFDALGLATSFPELFVETASDDRMARAGGAGSGCTSHVQIPYASTDRARFVLRGEDNWNRLEYYFSEYFTIRPDPRIGDAPPAVQMLAPAAGQRFHSNGVLPIVWRADDDQGLHEFRIQASFNGGRSFHTIAPSLPPDARSYYWKLPRSTGIADLRIRVVAVDTLLQNTADGDERVLQVLASPTPGAPPHLAPPPGG